MPIDRLRKATEGPASTVVTAGQSGVGVALTAYVTEDSRGPIDYLYQAAQEAGLSSYFAYGPVVVNKRHRRRGLS